MDLLEIGTIVKVKRKALALKQHELGLRSGVDRSVISRLEQHKLPDIGYNKVERIMNALSLELTTRHQSPLPTLMDLQEEGDE